MEKEIQDREGIKRKKINGTGKSCLLGGGGLVGEVAGGLGTRSPGDSCGAYREKGIVVDLF